jgi:cytochrome c-type biogenesis protein CcmH/NrfG
VARMYLALHPQSFWSYNLLGEIQLTLGDTVAAHAAYAAAAKLAPYDASARLGLARTQR